MKHKVKKPKGWVDKPESLQDIVASIQALGYNVIVTPRVRPDMKRGKPTYFRTKLK